MIYNHQKIKRDGNRCLHAGIEPIKCELIQDDPEKGIFLVKLLEKKCGFPLGHIINVPRKLVNFD